MDDEVVADSECVLAVLLGRELDLAGEQLNPVGLECGWAERHVRRHRSGIVHGDGSIGALLPSANLVVQHILRPDHGGVRDKGLADRAEFVWIILVDPLLQVDAGVARGVMVCARSALSRSAQCPEHSRSGSPPPPAANIRDSGGGKAHSKPMYR
ncbi:MAG TPA: hypothetical protein VE197_02540 [Mycobacterium sp.]|nr:hypothetical protein [Mycobacterium sp.]